MCWDIAREIECTKVVLLKIIGTWSVKCEQTILGSGHLRY